MEHANKLTMNKINKKNSKTRVNKIIENEWNRGKKRRKSE